VPDAPSLDLARVAQRIGSIAREYTELCLKGAPRYSEENFAQEVERVLREEVRKSLGILMLAASIATAVLRRPSIRTMFYYISI